jgi:alanyl-tRNA synthetase
MHPLVPFLMGQKHPLGKRIANVQKCIRTSDIEKVGNEVHHTFFEMLGNWSFGDYFKKEAIELSFEFLTKTLKLPIEKISVTCFKGDSDAPKDEEASEIWLKLGIPKQRIAFLPKEDNWWGPAGETGPCGPDSEMFFYVGKGKPSKESNPGTEKENWVEIWNDVFMQYNKTSDGKFPPLKQKNVDTGMGVERTLAVLNRIYDDYLTEMFLPSIKKIEALSEKKYEKEKVSMRIIADHLRAATFILGDEKHITPSNVDQGYVLRRLIRRAVRHAKLLGIEKNFAGEIAKIVIDYYKGDYKELKANEKFILDELEKEENKFHETLEKGLKEFEKILKEKMNQEGAKSSHKEKKEYFEMPEFEINGKEAFFLYQSFGLPLEVLRDLAKENNIKLDERGFNAEYEHHQKLSRQGAEQKFKGGLGEISEETTRLHTATHLLNEALRRIVDKNIHQRGSNITPERLRFDFNYNQKLSPEQLRAVENEVNSAIKKAMPVERKEMKLDEAKKFGAQAMFSEKYGGKVSVYKIGSYSAEICAGPHVKNTKELGKFKIVKEEAVAAGIRRIKAVLE